ncbi:MAG: hypothetical protein HY902_11215, partial [Deltaproteobacteria bacterium]|nr:hypothetical protein [Deltaproteobacteria bacterium]
KVSMIADKILGTVAKKRKEAKAAGATSMAQRGQADAAKEAADIAAMEQKRIKDAQERARQEALKYGVVGKQEQAVGVTGPELTQKDVTKLCREKEGILRGCGKKFDAEAGFKLKLTFETSGRISAVQATVDGKANGDLGSCIRSQLAGVRLDPPKATTTYDCKVD